MANPNDANFIAAALPEGKRALTLKVDAISGVGGYIYPGDRVDILLTHRIPIDLVDSTKPVVQQSVPASFAETLLGNIKVLATEIRGLESHKKSSEQSRSRKRQRISLLR